jgi:hypothetical protein
MCRKLGLYGEELTANDGTKFRANNSLKNHYGKTVVRNELSRIDQKITDYLNAVEEGDKAGTIETSPRAEELKTALEALRQRKIDYEELESQLVVEGELSTVDADSRLMRSGGDGRKIDVGYNVQTIVDSKYGMIVDFEVTNNSSDVGNLYKMTEKAKEVLEVEELTNLSDKGYYDSKDIVACEGNGVTCLVAKRRPGGAVKEKEFSLERFVYDAGKDQYTCPNGSHMTHTRNQKKNRGTEYRVYANYGACRNCEKKLLCTKYKYREVWRLPCQEVLDLVDERTRNNKELYRRRKEIVEHPYGTIKSVWGYKQFLCRTKPKVTAETALTLLAYNMRRTVNIFKESKLIPVFT